MERADDGDTAKHIGENEDDTPSIDRAIVETADKAGGADAREANRYKEQDGNEKSSPHVYLVRPNFIRSDGLAVYEPLSVHGTLHMSWHAIARPRTR
jgi:hypothetical protein